MKDNRSAQRETEMTAIVDKILEPNVQAGLAVAGKTCLVLGALVLAQSASAFLVFSL